MTEKSSSLLVPWSSLALFVTCAAISRAWCQRSEPAERGRQKTRADLQRDYCRRRRRSRLSPPRSRSLFYQHTSLNEEDEEEEEAANVSGHPPERSLIREDPGGVDFYPKNKNWRHFESRNEQDVMNGLIPPPQSDSDGDSSSSVSDEFVWTQSKRRTHHHGKNGINGSTAWNKIRRFTPLGAISAFRKLTEEVRSDDDEASSRSIPSSDDEDMRQIEENSYAGDEADAFMKSRQRSYYSTTSSDLTTSRSLFEEALIEEGGPEAVDLEKKRGDKSSPEVAAYNASILPAKVIMIRHGQSEGNINESLYATTPDNSMRLTQLGWDQAHMAGQALKEKVLASGESVHFIVSPYVRAVETFHGIVSAWCDPSEFNHIKDRDERIKAWYGRLLEMGLTWHEDPRIREQDFGNYQDPAIIKQCKRERHRFGVFFYRFPHGESASDVFDRVSTFLDSLWRSFDLHKTRNYVLVTHGISIRVFLARYFRYSIDQFSMLANPKNCEMVILGHDGEGKLRLQGRCDIELRTNEETKEKEVVGYKLHKRLRVLPNCAIRKVKIRVSPND